VTITIVKGSIKLPMKRRITCMMIKMITGCKLRPEARDTRPELAPLNARIWERAMAPAASIRDLLGLARHYDSQAFYINLKT